MNAIPLFRLPKTQKPVAIGLTRQAFNAYVDRVSNHLNQTQALVESIDTGLFEDVTSRLAGGGDLSLEQQLELVAASDRLSRLMSVLTRDLESAKTLVDRGYRDEPSDAPSSDDGPAWTFALRRYRAALAKQGPNASDKIAEIEPTALTELVHTRAPDFSAVLEKLRILRETGMIANKGFADELVLDAEHLTGA